jgi:tRNA 2-thiouridine synthesizing protein A
MAKTELNYRGMSCPVPIIKLSMATRKGAPGDEFEVISDDPAFEPDIKAWCEDTGNTLNGITKSGKDIVASITKKS